MKLTSLLGAVCLLFALAISANAAVITTYSSQAAWVAAAGGPIIVEDFNDGVFVPGFSIVSGDGSLVANAYEDVVDDTVSVNDQFTFGFNPSILAFGAFWDLANPGGPGSGIDIYAIFEGGGSQLLDPPPPTLPGSTNGFFGFVSDTPVVAIQVIGTSNPNAIETLRIDDAQFVVTPEPATLLTWGALSGVGLALGAWKRRRAVA